jgi:hypothetical protein
VLDTQHSSTNWFSNTSLCHQCSKPQLHNEGLLAFAFAVENTAIKNFAAKQMRNEIQADDSAASE